jgi:hypothetical protein
MMAFSGTIQRKDDNDENGKMKIMIDEGDQQWQGWVNDGCADSMLCYAQRRCMSQADDEYALRALFYTT